ncbi:MvaI/BcnI restriction endonuclease family protein [Candidatus Daviesbacteria bacterium]|nr:MvaI/BcnI restriction endonuclease family protein [Candidatus Daviesbacteria bacterium]
MQLYTKDELIKRLKKLAEMGWIPNGRFGNHGGIGNTLEDFLEIEENNLPIPNAAEWELKSQRANTTSLTTLFHMEPSPRAVGFVPKVLLPLYGWGHQGAGTTYNAEEMSFRQTIHGLSHSDRGFIVQIDRIAKKILVSFDASKVSEKHTKWLEGVKEKVGLGELNPQPYWGFDDLEHKAGTKLLNCFYVQAEVKTEKGKEFYWYNKAQMLQKFRFEGLLEALEKGVMLVDFDARTGHNHGTKFRLKQNRLPMLYEKVTTVVG